MMKLRLGFTNSLHDSLPDSDYTHESCYGMDTGGRLGRVEATETPLLPQCRP